MARQGFFNCVLLSIIVEYISSLPNCCVHYLWHPCGQFCRGNTLQITVLSSHRTASSQPKGAHHRHVCGIRRINVQEGQPANTPEEHFSS